MGNGQSSYVFHFYLQIPDGFTFPDMTKILHRFQFFYTDLQFSTPTLGASAQSIAFIEGLYQVPK